MSEITAHDSEHDTNTGQDATSSQPAADQSATAGEKPRKSRGARRGRRPRGGTYKVATAAIALYESFQNEDPATRVVAAAALGCEPQAGDLAATAVAAEETGGLSLFADLATLRDLDQLDAMVTAAEMGDSRLGHLWRFLCAMEGREASRLNSSTIKAARQVVAALEGMDADKSRTADRVAELLTA